MTKSSKGFALLVPIMGIVFVGVVGVIYFYLKGIQIQPDNYIDGSQFVSSETKNWKVFKHNILQFEFKYPLYFITDISDEANPNRHFYYLHLGDFNTLYVKCNTHWKL